MFFIPKDMAPQFSVVVAIAGAFALLVVGNGGAAPLLNGLDDAIRRAMNGERTSAPAGATGELLRIYDELSLVAERRKKESGDLSKRTHDLDETEKTLEDVARK